MSTEPTGTPVGPRSNATSITLAIVAPVALLVSFVPYFLGGLSAVYSHEGSDEGGFAAYGVIALVIGLGFPAWAVVWGIIEVRRTKQVPGGAALVLGALTLGIGLCVILPGSITIIRTSAELTAAYERENPRSEALATASAEARAARTANSDEGRAAKRTAPAERAAAKQRIDSVSAAVLDGLEITPAEVIPPGQPSPTGAAAAGSARVTASASRCDAGYGPQAGLSYSWQLELDDSADPVATADAFRAAITADAPSATFSEQDEGADVHVLLFDADPVTREVHGTFTWGVSSGGYVLRDVFIVTACH